MPVSEQKQSQKSEPPQVSRSNAVSPEPNHRTNPIVCLQRAVAPALGHDFRRIPINPISGGEAAPDTGPAVRAAEQVGAPLPREVRSYFEPRFGHDFSRVRLHADDEAAAAAHAVHARAYTIGRDIVFDRGEYAPHTNEGIKLLAHELVHVVQQVRGGPCVARWGINSPDDAAEREADSAAETVAAGHAVTPRAALSAGLHRKMHNKAVLEPVRAGAKACLVHLHGEEHTAAAVARELYGRRCVNYVHLDTEQGPLTGLLQRLVQFDVDVDVEEKSGDSKVKSKVNFTCTADPNRVFSEKGRNQTVDCTPTAADDKTKKVPRADLVKAAAGEIEKFVNTDWGKGISLCRLGKGTPDLAGPLPVLALHNNEGDAPILDKYKPQWAPLSDPRLKGGPNPDYSADPKNKSDVFFVADPPAPTGSPAKAADFEAVKGTHNVGLQAQPVPAAGEDGSLSVALQNERFINVEKLGRDHANLVNLGSGFQGHDSVYIKNYAMAVKALEVLNVPEGPCPAAVPATLPQPAPAAPQPVPATPQPAPPTTVPPKAGSGATQKADEEEKKKTEPYPLEKVEDKDVPKGCRHFEPSSIGSQKSYWNGRLATLPVLDVVNWIVGAWDLNSTFPATMPEVVREGVNESLAQRKCLLAAMQSGVKAQGGKLPKGSLMASGARSFAEQSAIWEDKWKFEGKKNQTFDRISSNAAAKSKGLLKEGDKWDTTKTIHKLMWGAVAPTNNKVPDVALFLKQGATNILPREREQEILMASSAPGVSRHHAGTDFDIGEKGTGKDELEPELWQPGERYFDAGRWLFHNAATWGFMRPFETKGGYGKGYMAEPWHWSYWPIAQALLEFARKNQKDMEDMLHMHWQDSSKNPLPQFQFVWGAWKSFLNNVDETPRF